MDIAPPPSDALDELVELCRDDSLIPRRPGEYTADEINDRLPRRRSDRTMRDYLAKMVAAGLLASRRGCILVNGAHRPCNLYWKPESTK